MGFAERPRAGINREVMCVWDENKEIILFANNDCSMNPDLQLVKNELPAFCEPCAEISHRSNAYTLSGFGWVLRLRRCRYCGCSILVSNKEEIRFVYKN